MPDHVHMLLYFRLVLLLEPLIGEFGDSFRWTAVA